MEKMERFLLSRCRGGAELTNNTSVGVRHCDTSIVAEDLKERGLWKANMGEAEQRTVMEARLRLEDEYKGMRVLRRDKRFEAKRGLSTDIDRVIIDTLHAPMRMNEKVLYLLYSKAYDNRTKAKAQPVFDIMTKKLKVIGALGDGWGPSWDEKKSDKLGSFALPCDQSKRTFNLKQLPQLLEVVDIACSGRAEDGKKMGSFLTEHLQVLHLLCLTREYEEGEVNLLGRHLDRCFQHLIEMHGGGQQGATNYFHALGAGHITWLSRKHGNLWRFRNEGKPPSPPLPSTCMHKTMASASDIVFDGSR
jgi:hypothetical protein